MKKLFGLIMLVALLTGILAACAPAATPTAAAEPTKAPESTKAPEATQLPEPTKAVEPTKAQEKTLELWMNGDELVNKYWTDVVNAFNAANPGITVVYKPYANEPYKTALQVAIASQKPPDIFFNWAGDDTFRYARENNILDLTPAVTQFGWDKNISAAARDAFSTGGKLYAAPYSLEAKYMYYNKGMFAKNGWKIPETFTQLLDLCKTIKAAGITPLAFGNQERWEGVHYLSLFNEKVVGEKQIYVDYSLTPAKDALFTDPKYETAFQRLLDVQKAGCFADAVNSTTPDSALAQFYTEQTAMYWQGTWIMGALASNAFGDKYAMFRMPPMEGEVGNQNYVLMGPIGLEISSKTPFKDEALKFLDFALSKENQMKQVKELSRLPVRADAVDPAAVTPQFKSVVDDLAKAEGAVGWLDTVLENSISEAYLNNIQEVLSGSKTPKQAVEAIRTAALAAKEKLGK